MMSSLGGMDYFTRWRLIPSEIEEIHHSVDDVLLRYQAVSSEEAELELVACVFYLEYGWTSTSFARRSVPYIFRLFFARGRTCAACQFSSVQGSGCLVVGGLS
jgi:hypothetical protein